MSRLNPTGFKAHTEQEQREPTFPPEFDEYEPLNADLTEGDWPDLSDFDPPLYRIGSGDPNTEDPYEWRREHGTA